MHRLVRGPASADSELSRFSSSYGEPCPAITPGSGGRPELMHHPTEAPEVSFGGEMAGSFHKTKYEDNEEARGFLERTERPRTTL
jgi:hypothetical protein